MDGNMGSFYCRISFEPSSDWNLLEDAPCLPPAIDSRRLPMRKSRMNSGWSCFSFSTVPASKYSFFFSLTLPWRIMLSLSPRFMMFSCHCQWRRAVIQWLFWDTATQLRLNPHILVWCYNILWEGGTMECSAFVTSKGRSPWSTKDGCRVQHKSVSSLRIAQHDAPYWRCTQCVATK